MNTQRPFFDGISDGISGGETSGTQLSFVGDLLPAGAILKTSIKT